MKAKDEIDRYLKYINKEYTSTRFENDESKSWGMMEVLLNGMVPIEHGGGLFVRQGALPHFDVSALERIASLPNYQQRVHPLDEARLVVELSCVLSYTF